MKSPNAACYVSCLALSLLCASQPGLQAAEPTRDPSARLLRDASLMLLKEGNARYVSGKPQHPHADAERRSSTVANGQEPFATILACSDSREPVELIFDRGVGDLFVVRVAGNIAGQSELATVEYGVGHLNTPLLIVMGHTKCGAVTAVVKGAELHGHLHALAARIQPAAEKAKAESSQGEDPVARAIQANVWNTIETVIKESSILREKIGTGRVTVHGALYDLEQGTVNWLGSHPAQDALVALANQGETDPGAGRVSVTHGKAVPNNKPVTHTPATAQDHPVATDPQAKAPRRAGNAKPAAPLAASDARPADGGGGDARGAAADPHDH